METMPTRYQVLRANFDRMAHNLVVGAFLLTREQRAIYVRRISDLVVDMATEIEGSPEEVAILESLWLVVRRVGVEVRLLDQVGTTEGNVLYPGLQARGGSTLLMPILKK